MQKIVLSKISDILLGIDYPFLLNLTSKRKRQFTQSSIIAKVKQRSILGDLLLRYLLHTVHGMKDFNLIYNMAGKPYLSGEKNIFFNISHSGEWVVCALSSEEIGVDINITTEPISIKEWEGMGEFFLSEEERDLIKLLLEEERYEKYYYYWTQKESFVKCIGLGITVLERYRFMLDNHEYISVNGTDFYFREFQIEDTCKMHVCSKNIRPVSYVDIKQCAEIVEFMKKNYEDGGRR